MSKPSLSPASWEASPVLPFWLSQEVSSVHVDIHCCSLHLTRLGTMVDLFNRERLQFPMVIYSAVQFLGPVLGPVVGGFITQFTTW